jgi:hypothetical protein
MNQSRAVGPVGHESLYTGFMTHRLKSKQPLGGIYAQNSEEFRSRNDAARFWYKVRDEPRDALLNSTNCIISVFDFSL